MTDIEKNTSDVSKKDSARVRRRQLLKTGAIAAPLIVTLSQGASASWWPGGGGGGTGGGGGGGGEDNFSMDCGKRFKKLPLKIPKNYEHINYAYHKHHGPQTPSSWKWNFDPENDGHWAYIKHMGQHHEAYSCAVSMQMPGPYYNPEHKPNGYDENENN